MRAKTPFRSEEEAPSRFQVLKEAVQRIALLKLFD